MQSRDGINERCNHDDDLERGGALFIAAAGGDDWDHEDQGADQSL